MNLRTPTSRLLTALALSACLLVTGIQRAGAQGLVLSQLAQGFGKNKVRYDKFDWWVMETEHTKLFYTPRYEHLAEIAAAMLERAYEKVSNDFHHRLSEKPPVILYESPYAFQQNNIILDVLPAGVGGFAEALRYRVVTPFNGSLEDLERVLTHELAHIFTYDLLYGGPIKGLLTNLNPPPDWIMEGLSTHAEGEMTTQEDMVLRDAVLYNQLIPLGYMSNFNAVPRVYLAYRQSQSLMEYIHEKYGLEAVRAITRGWRINANIHRLVRRELGLSLESLEADWTNHLRRKYWSQLGQRSYVQEIAERVLVQRSNELAYYQNPVWSPGGQMLAVHSVEKAALPAVVTYNVVGLVEESPRGDQPPAVAFKEWEVTRGLWEDKYEDLGLEQGQLSWSRNGERIAFVGRKGKVDRIFLWNVYQRRLEAVLTPKGIRQVLSISLSPDGSAIALCGTRAGQPDIYILTAATGALEQITDTPNLDTDVSWSPSGQRLAYSTDHEGDHDLALYDFATQGFERIAWRGSNERLPAWWPDERALAFVSDQDGVSNLYRLELDSTHVRQLTRCINGLSTPAVSPDGKRIAFAAYRDGNMEVYVKACAPEPADSTFVLTRVLQDSAGSSQPPAGYAPDRRYSRRRYQTALDIDYLAGTAMYSNEFFGALLQLSTSDLLGDHRINVTTDFWAATDNLNNLNFVLSYYNYAHRLVWGVGIFSWGQYYRVWSENEEEILRERQVGYWVEAAYPLDFFRRLELSYTSTEEREELIDSADGASPKSTRFFNLGYVFDSTVYGAVGPRAGGKYYLALGKTLKASELGRDFEHVQTDLRRYFPLGRYSALKMRVRGVASLGADPITHYLGGPPPVMDYWYTPIEGPLRGYDYGAFSGTRLVLANLEFNTVLIKRFVLGWPEDFSLGRFDGTFFVDAGSIWDEDQTAFRDVKTSLGFGLRPYPFGLPLNIEFARRLGHGESKEWKVHFSIRAGF